MISQDQPQDANNPAKHPSSESFIIENKDKDKQAYTTDKPSHKKKKPRFLNWCDRNKSIIELIVMVVGIFTLSAYIIVSWDQSIKTQKAIEKADSANAISKQSIAYSKEAVDLSELVFNYTKESDIANDKRFIEDALDRKDLAIKELRAYITVNEPFLKISQNPTMNDSVIFYITILNNGKTPAYIDAFWLGEFIGDPTDRELLDIIENMKKIDTRLGNLGPGQFTTIDTQITEFDSISFNDFIMRNPGLGGKRLKNDPLGRKALALAIFYYYDEGLPPVYIIGRVEYTDFFGNSSCYTQFCFRYNAKTRNFIFSNKYNKAE